MNYLNDSLQFGRIQLLVNCIAQLLFLFEGKNIIIRDRLFALFLGRRRLFRRLRVRGFGRGGNGRFLLFHLFLLVLWFALQLRNSATDGFNLALHHGDSTWEESVKGEHVTSIDKLTGTFILAVFFLLFLFVFTHGLRGEVLPLLIENAL